MRLEKRLRRNNLVAQDLQKFGKELNDLMSMLDKNITPETVPNPTQIQAIITACAWTHAEWVRIHPLCNGNGRIARLWADLIAMRYNLPPFIVLRPRPDGEYANAGYEAMKGNYKPTISVFSALFVDYNNSHA